jgi:hypothetical protein
MSGTPDVYARFCEEVDALVIAASDPAVKVVGDLTRAVKRAQMVVDGDLRPVRERLGVASFDVTEEAVQRIFEQPDEQAPEEPR